VDDRYAPYLSVALSSIVENRDPDKLYAVHILTEELSEENRARLLATVSGAKNVFLNFTSVAKRVALFGDKLHLRDYYTKTTYYRFFIADLFPEYERGIYLDCDIIVNTDVSRITEYRSEGALLSAVTDEVVTDIPTFAEYSEKFLGIPRQNYFNAGVLVLELKEMRKCGFEKAICELMDKYTFPVAQDQDYLNLLCAGRTLYLPLSWNKTAFPECNPSVLPDIVHFKLAYKPWHYRGVAYEEMFWKYAELTPYYNELKAERDSYTKELAALDRKQYENLISLARKEIERAENGDKGAPAVCNKGLVCNFSFA